jgi:hypothetical protein
VTNNENLTTFHNFSCFTYNIFSDNAAEYGGAAITINGFNTSELFNDNLGGSCPGL